MVDNVMREFINDAALLERIGDEIVDLFLGTRPRLFRTDPGTG